MVSFQSITVGLLVVAGRLACAAPTHKNYNGPTDGEYMPIYVILNTS